MKKLLLLTAFGAGYVLGAKAGRTRYEQIRSAWSRFSSNPQVQAAVGKTGETVAHEAAVVKEKVAAAASSAMHRNGSSEETGWPSDSQAPYPPMG